MAVNKRTNPSGKTVWRWRKQDKAGRWHSGTCATKKAALAEERNLQIEWDDGRVTDPRGARFSLGEWRTRWTDGRTDIRPSTRVRDEGMWRKNVEPFLGHVPLGDIDRALLQRWIDGLQETGRLAPSSIVTCSQLVTGALKAAHEARLIRAIPQGVKLPPIEMTQERYLTSDEVNRLVRATNPLFRPLVLTACYTGLRRGELFGLRASRVDLARPMLTVDQTLSEIRGQLHYGEPKTKAGKRAVPLSGKVVDALGPLLAERGRDDLVFVGQHGKPLRQSWVGRHFKPAVKAAGLEPLRMHDLRHTAVSLWLASGAEPKQIAQWAGHKSVSTVYDRYVHLMPGNADPVMAALDAL